jgi:hypothetical protein
MAKTVRRSVRPLAVAVLLAGLQMPLCAMTCLAAADGPVEPMAEHRAASHCPERALAGSPQPSDAAPPIDPGDPHGDCGCDGAQAVVASWTDAAPPALAVVARPMVQPARPEHGPAQLATGSETDLPPPDLLLLHSILLI